jgi:hypothetical protein
VRYRVAVIQDKPIAAFGKVAEREAVDAETFEREIATSYQPVVLRGQVAGWPAVEAGRQGGRAIAAYLAAFGGGKPLETLIGPPAIGGRFFYNDDLSGFNFRRQHVPLTSLLAELVRLDEEGAEAPHAIYANAATAPEHLPGWGDANPLGLPSFGATPRLWIGNRGQVATHYDNSYNVAAVVAGHRRFTLFPPEQLPNLYVGPLDRTLAGPPVSLVDPDAPDLQAFPRFAEAARHGQVAELGPGDALFIPAIWWHHVRALDAVNVLVNYWWNVDPTVSAFPAMVHAIMSLRDLPPAEKAAWRVWFDHYVFGEGAGEAGAHLPAAAQGVLGPPSPERTERIRGYLLNSLQPRH